jgi:hypothetical protein
MTIYVKSAGITSINRSVRSSIVIFCPAYLPITGQSWSRYWPISGRSEARQRLMPVEEREIARKFVAESGEAPANSCPVRGRP